MYLHEELYKLLERAFDGAGIPWNRCFREDRGDGVLTVIPPGTACKKIIDPLPERLRGLIRRHNHVFRDAAAIQLRIAPTSARSTTTGTDSSAATSLFRMLNARPLKRALTSSGAELALIISDYLYRNIVCRYPSLISPDAFQQVRFQDQYISTQAWACLPACDLSGSSPRRCRPPAHRTRSGHVPIILSQSNSVPAPVRCEIQSLSPGRKYKDVRSA